MHFHGVAFDIIVPAIEALLQGIAGQDMAGLADQLMQQAVFTPGQSTRLTLIPDLLTGRVQGYSPALNPQLRPATAPPEPGPESGVQLADSRGFGQTILGTGTQPRNAVLCRITGRRAQHRRRIALGA